VNRTAPTTPPFSAPNSAGTSGLTTPEAFMKASQSELDDLFRRCVPGPIPVGDSEGSAIFRPGSIVARIVAPLARWLMWKGKVFYPEQKQLLNKLTPFSIRAIRANVYVDKSWLDGQDTIVLDYSKTSVVCGMIRDEIREVVPGVYLGKVWLWRWRVLDFALRF
jgi:hypothetical protein